MLFLLQIGELKTNKKMAPKRSKGGAKTMLTEQILQRKFYFIVIYFTISSNWIEITCGNLHSTTQFHQDLALYLYF